MLPTKFQFIWQSDFREDLNKSSNQKQELPVAAMFVNESGQNEQSLQRIFQGCSLPSFDSFGQAVSEEKIYNKQHDTPVVNIHTIFVKTFFPITLKNRLQFDE